MIVFGIITEKTYASRRFGRLFALEETQQADKNKNQNNKAGYGFGPENFGDPVVRPTPYGVFASFAKSFVITAALVSKSGEKNK